jgi:hypothetical protein
MQIRVFTFTQLYYGRFFGLNSNLQIFGGQQLQSGLVFGEPDLIFGSLQIFKEIFAFIYIRKFLN